MFRRHRARAPSHPEDNDDDDAEDVFSALARRPKKKAKSAAAATGEEPKTAPSEVSITISTAASAAKAPPQASHGSISSENNGNTKNEPLVASTTSSMKRHHKEMSNGRKAKMDAMLQELQTWDSSSTSTDRGSGHHRRGGGSKSSSNSGGSHVEPGQEHLTTNIFVGNLAPTLTEDELTRVFGQFGDLYSVKIMWPRTAEERARQRLTGFVCYYQRPDAEAAMEACNEADPFGVGRRLMMRWGKNVLLQQQQGGDEARAGGSGQNRSASVSGESSNSAALHSQSAGGTEPAATGTARIQGQLPSNPPARQEDQDERVRHPQRPLRSAKAPNASKQQRRPLSREELEVFHQLTRRELCASREAIAQAMAFCFEKASHSAPEIAHLLHDLLLQESSSAAPVSVDTRIARLYLLSDILYNSQQPGIRNAFYYRDAIEQMAPPIFASLGSGSAGRLTHHKLAKAVSAVLAAWTQWSVYNPAFLDELHARFEGRFVEKEANSAQDDKAVAAAETKTEAKEAAEQAAAAEEQVANLTPRGGWEEVDEEDEDNNPTMMEDATTTASFKKKEDAATTNEDASKPCKKDEEDLPTCNDADGEPLVIDPDDKQSLENAPTLNSGDGDADGESLDGDADGEPLDGDADGEPLDGDADGEPLDADGEPLDGGDPDGEPLGGGDPDGEPLDGDADGEALDGDRDPLENPDGEPVDDTLL